MDQFLLDGQLKCLHPDCDLRANPDPQISIGFCCERCEGRFKGEEWASQGKKKHTAFCTGSARAGNPIPIAGLGGEGVGEISPVAPLGVLDMTAGQPLPSSSVGWGALIPCEQGKQEGPKIGDVVKSNVFQVPELPPPSEGERFEGLVQEWRPKGFGFCILKDGRRVYIHCSSFGGGDLEIGQTINGILQQDPKNPGKWQAMDVSSGAIGDDGILVEWHADQGYGFLTMDDNRRAYLHHTCFGKGDLIIGTRFRVLLKNDDRNPDKFCVHQLREELPSIPGYRPGSGPPGAGLSTNDGFHPGTVEQWNEKGGYGFIKLDDGRRLYVHHTAFGGGQLVEGQRCEAIPTNRTHEDSSTGGRGDGWRTKVLGAAVVRGEGVSYKEPMGPRNPQAGPGTNQQHIQAAEQQLSAASAYAAYAQAGYDPATIHAAIASMQAQQAAAQAQAQAQAQHAAATAALYGIPLPQYAVAPPQYGVPPHPYATLPPQYGVPPPQYGAPPPGQYFAAPQLYGAPPTQPPVPAYGVAFGAPPPQVPVAPAPTPAPLPPPEPEPAGPFPKHSLLARTGALERLVAPY